MKVAKYYMNANIIIENSITKKTIDIPCKIIAIDYSNTIEVDIEMLNCIELEMLHIAINDEVWQVNIEMFECEQFGSPIFGNDYKYWISDSKLIGKSIRKELKNG